ncbi:MAG: NAD(P)H-binding protein [Pseudomonadota bacterium]
MKALITGATGMVGNLVLQHCLQSKEVSEVVSLVRRSGELDHNKLTEIIVPDFQDLKAVEKSLNGVDIVFYCLGAYTGSVDRETLRVVTVDYPEALADHIKLKSPNARFCLLSGAGADKTGKSRTPFAQDKGEIENRLSAKGLGSFHTFRPAYIYPVSPRDEPGFGYTLMRWLYPIIRLLGDGASIQSTQLAKAMFDVGLTGHKNQVLENRDILNILKTDH